MSGNYKLRLPLLLGGLLAIAVACNEPSRNPATPATQTAASTNNSQGTNQWPQIYFVKGEVRELKEDGKTAIIKHEEIPGYMEAMTMPFEVKDPKDLAGVKPGDKVMFRMLVTEKDGWIDRIQVLESPGMGKPPEPTTRVVRNVEPLQLGDKVPNYSFTNELGNVISLKEYEGKAVAFSFIFTRCPYPNFCPRMSENMADAYKIMTTNSNMPTNWHMFSITFDVKFDTPQMLRNYAKRYKYDPEKWNFLTGALIDIDAITEQFGLVFSRQEGTFNYDHTLRTVVLDPQGKVFHVFVGNEWKAEELADRISAAARGEPPQKPPTFD